MTISNAFWKMSQFKGSPVENIIIGDSRIYLLNEKYISEIAGEQYFNFGLPAGNCQSAIDIFWYCDKIIKLKNVVIGVSFHTYNAFVYYDLFSEINAIHSNPILYFNSRRVIRDSLYLFKKQYIDPLFTSSPAPVYKKKIRPLTISDSTFNEIWEKGIHHPFFNSYKYPERYYNEFKKISDHCKNNNINLTFVIFPNPIELQKHIINLGLADQRNKFKTDIRSFGILFDFDYENRITADKQNYNDPLHVKTEISNQIIREIWGDTPGIARHYYPPR